MQVLLLPGWELLLMSLATPAIVSQHHKTAPLLTVNQCHTHQAWHFFYSALVWVHKLLDM